VGLTDSQKVVYFQKSPISRLQQTDCILNLSKVKCNSNVNPRAEKVTTEIIIAIIIIIIATR
jgi:hypothetical protein